MRTILLASAGCFAIASGAMAAPPPAKAAAPTVTDIVTAIGNMTAQDITTALQIANVPVPPDAEAVTCMTWMQNQLPTVGSGGQAFIPPTGILSTIETAHIGVGRLTNGLLANSLKVPFEVNCGPWIMSLMGDVQALGAVGIVGAKTVVPFLAATKAPEHK